MRSLPVCWSLSVSMTMTVSRSGRARLLTFLLAAGCATSGSTGSTVRPSPLPTARDYGRIEQEVLAALNEARTDPRGSAAWLDELAGYFTGTRLKRPWWPFALQTREGVDAVREAAAAMRAQAPVTALSMSAALVRAARDHVNDQGRTGAMGHTGTDGSTTMTRVNRYATWRVSIAENIDYQPMVRGRDVIESLLVDDGVSDRGHRRNIYQSSARLVGIACGPHPKYEAMCVIVQTGGISAKP